MKGLNFPNETKKGRGEGREEEREREAARACQLLLRRRRSHRSVTPSGGARERVRARERARAKMAQDSTAPSRGSRVFDRCRLGSLADRQYCGGLQGRREERRAAREECEVARVRLSTIKRREKG